MKISLSICYWILWVSFASTQEDDLNEDILHRFNKWLLDNPPREETKENHRFPFNHESQILDQYNNARGMIMDPAGCKGNDNCLPPRIQRQYYDNTRSKMVHPCLVDPVSCFKRRRRIQKERK
nr:uncharacterized protein LOC121114382 [Lepeophtheirus salmonis]